MAKLFISHELLAALRAAGLADDNTRRVVIDIRYDQPPIVYTERFGDPESLVDVVMAAGVEIKRAVEEARLNSPAPLNPEHYCTHVSKPYDDFPYLQCARRPGHDGLHGAYFRMDILAWGDDGRISSGHPRIDKLNEGRHARELGVTRRLGEKPNTIDAAHSKYARAQALDMTCVICGADIGEECVPIDSAMMFDPGLHHLRKNRYDALMEKGERVERKDG